jgi:prevent-host-death family protein
MRISVTEAKAQLTDLVRRAESGEDIVLTRHGHAVVRLTAMTSAPGAAARRRILETISQAGAAKIVDGPSAARSQDFLYDDEGLPK